MERASMGRLRCTSDYAARFRTGRQADRWWCISAKKRLLAYAEETIVPLLGPALAPGPSCRSDCMHRGQHRGIKRRQEVMVELSV